MKTISVIILLAVAVTSPLTATVHDKPVVEKKEKAKPYPLKNCIVSDELLGDMGGDECIFMEYNGQIYGFCCKPCVKDFLKNPKKFEAKFKKLTISKK